jgi:hypothetical protein
MSDTGFTTGRTTPRAITRSSGKKGLDGRVYPAEVEDELNRLAARVLGTPDGIRFTNYLRGITMNVAFLGDVSPQELMHMEGQRWLVGLMLSRVKAGNRPS